MIILPCLSWILAHGTYLTFVFLIMFSVGLLRLLIGGRSK